LPPVENPCRFLQIISELPHLADEGRGVEGGGELAALVGVHKEVGRHGDLHLDGVGGVLGQLTVLIEAVHAITGPPFVALALVELFLAELIALHTGRLATAGPGDVTTVAQHGVAVVQVLSCMAVVSKLRGDAGLDPWAALISSVGAPGALLRVTWQEVAGVPLGGEGVLVLGYSRTAFADDRSSLLVPDLLVAVVVHGVAALHGVGLLTVDLLRAARAVLPL